MTTINDYIQPKTARFSYFRTMLAFLSERLEARRIRTEARRTIEILGSLDDCTLRDIGVTRCELGMAERNFREFRRAGTLACAGGRGGSSN